MLRIMNIFISIFYALFKSLMCLTSCCCDLEKLVFGSQVETLIDNREEREKIQKVVIDGFVYGCKMVEGGKCTCVPELCRCKNCKQCEEKRKMKIQIEN